jgi:uncharacterized protein (UPF0335 family)
MATLKDLRERIEHLENEKAKLLDEVKELRHEAEGEVAVLR